MWEQYFGTWFYVILVNIGGSYCGNNIVVNEICEWVLGFDVIIVNPRALRMPRLTAF